MLFVLKKKSVSWLITAIVIVKQQVAYLQVFGHPTVQHSVLNVISKV